MDQEQKIILKISSEEPLKSAEKEEIQLAINNQIYTLQSNHEDRKQITALRRFILPSLLAAFIFFMFFFIRGNRIIPLSGTISIASVSIILGLVSGMTTFAVYFIKEKRRGTTNLYRINWRNFPTLMIAFSLITAIVMLFYFWILGVLFAGLVLDIYLSTLFSFIFFSVINYGMVYCVTILSPSLLTKLLVSVTIGGVIIAMITNREAQWWQRNLSFLGSQEAARSWQFNMTLILAAFLLLSLIDYLFVNLREHHPRHLGLKILRVLLSLMSVSLGLVGYFPSDGSGNAPAYHNQAAGMLVIMVIIMIVGIKWFVPKISKEMVLISYLIGVLLIVVSYLYVNGSYITLTGFELVAFFLAFSWLILLIQSLDKASRAPVPIYQVDVVMLAENVTNNESSLTDDQS